MCRGGDDDGILSQQPAPSLPILETFWIPEEVPKPWQESWERWLITGSHYRRTVTKPYRETGEVNKYVPEYMLFGSLYHQPLIGRT